MSDDVTQFLQQVQQLQGSRDENDEARSRELEEKILQEKSERAARRAEVVTSEHPPPPSHRDSRAADHRSLASSPRLESPFSRRGAPADTSESTMNNPSTSPTRDRDASHEPEPKRTSGSPGGARPLSWQRRPSQSPDKQPRSRPLSMMAAQNAARTSNAASPDPSSAAAEEETFSKDRIAQALAGKDPAWFRQTSDRGSNSPAYRRNQVEDDDRSDVHAGRSQLPGMMSNPSNESPVSLPPLRRSKTGGSILDMTSSPRLDPPADYESRTLERSPTRADGRSSPTRANSPTKGMGGFVQSAMMKRSDSVKRWSVASPPGLARADTVASNRGSLIERAAIGSQANSRSRPTSMIRDGSTTPTPRLQGSDEDRSIEPATVGSQAVADPTPDTGSNLRITTSTPPAQEGRPTTPPASPSKMDSRRWSPTKSSWLDAALNKPEAPKQKPAAPQSNQPAWMVELNRAKAQRATNPDAAAKAEPAAHKHEVKIGGLMRPIPSTTAKGTAVSVGTPYASTTTPPSSERSRIGSSLKPSSLSRPASTDPTTPDLPAANEPASRPSAISVGNRNRPETPTGVDFRANLKPRLPASDAQTGSVNELSAVFGKLRKTKTQNYVAPDELKGNILRGKSALNVTGGPKKTERKDEFKEAILKKKEDFQKAQAEGTGVVRSSNTPTQSPMPEGLIRRNELAARSATLSNRDSVSSDTTIAASSIQSNRDSLATDITGTDSAITSPAFKSARSPLSDSVFDDTTLTQRAAAPKSPIPSPAAAPREFAAPSRVAGRVGGGSLANRFNPNLAGLLARGPPAASTNKAPDSSAESPAETASDPSGGPKLTHITKGRARGPRRKAPSSAAPASAQKSSTSPPSSTPPATLPEASSPPTTSDQVQLVDSSKMASSVVSAKAAPPSQILIVNPSKPDPVDQVRLVDSSSSMSPSYNKPYSPYTRRKENDSNSAAPAGQIKLVDSSAMREAYAAATPTRERGGSISSLSNFGGSTPTREVRGSYSSVSSIKGSIASQVAASAVQRSSPLTPKAKAADPKDDEPKEQPQPSSPKKLNMNRISKFIDDPERNSTPDPVKETRSSQSRPSSPVKAPESAPQANESPRPLSKSLPQPPQATPGSATRALPQSPSPSKDTMGAPSRLGTSVKNAAAMFSSGASPSPTKESVPTFTTTEPEGLRSRSRSPTKVGNRPPPLSPRARSQSRPGSPMRSPTRQAVEVSNLLTDFFGPSRPKREYRADAAEILMKRPATANGIKTVSTQRLQIFGDGKMVQVPSYNDRVLFEREMYVCSHTFNNQAGKKATEVYFWSGDEVPAATARGAEAVAAREARSVGGKLVVLRQGKETPAFLAALGGVVITRRGSSNKYDSLAPNMLCGRRYLGCVAFDEVDFSPASLCSGFPFLITQQGQCYLWKGKGSDGEEVDSAMLVGMDLSLTGRLEQVEDGEEPAGFWDVFEGRQRGPSADHWRLKPLYGKYCCRLFCSEAGDKQQITEITPYSQSDLSPQRIYVLDAFFEMYIIVGSQSTAQYPSFRNALDFAQEYAILASGAEDRPFVPVATVVLEGIPRDMKSVFRKWREGRGPTRTVGEGGSLAVGGEGGLSRGRSLRVVPLTQALQALAE